MGILYNISLLIHSWNRWIIIIIGLSLFITLFTSLSKEDNKISNTRGTAFLFLISLHIQLLIGLLLYFILSPLTKIAFSDFGSAMANADLRFWAVEHTLLNIIGITLVQIGYSKSKKKSGRDKNKALLLWMGIGFLIILLAIPFGIMGVERPWFRF